MGIALASRATGTAYTVGTTTITIPSATYNAGSFYIIYLAMIGPSGSTATVNSFFPIPGVTAGQATYIGSYPAPGGLRAYVVSGLCKTTTTGSISITVSSTSASVGYVVEELSGVNTSASPIVVQSVNGNTGFSTSGTVSATLNTFASSTNQAYFFSLGEGSGSTCTAKSGYSTVSNNTSIGGTPYIVFSELSPAADTAPNATYSDPSQNNIVSVGLELAAAVPPVIKTVVVTSGTSWTVPYDFTSTNTIECWGAGAGGQADNFSSKRGAGGGGAYSNISNLALSPGAVITYAVGAGGAGQTSSAEAVAGGDTWFNGATLAASSVGAKGGAIGTSGNTAGLGGAAASGIGTVLYSGGNGGAGQSSGSGGGGGGSGYAGGNGSVGTSGTSGTANGGAGGNSGTVTGGAGGTSGSLAGSTGSSATKGGGGGGGGYSDGSGGNGGNGGAPGGGGGGGGTDSASTLGGSGAGGQIVITYTSSGATPPPSSTKRRLVILIS